MLGSQCDVVHVEYVQCVSNHSMYEVSCCIALDFQMYVVVRCYTTAPDVHVTPECSRW